MRRRRLTTRTIRGVVLLCAVALAGRAAVAATVDFALGWERIDGEFGSDDETRLSRIPLDLVLGSRSSRLTITIPYVSINHTGNVTLMQDGPAILGVGGPGRPRHQKSRAGGSESGLGDIVLRDESFLMVAGQGKRPAVSFIAELKIPTADEEKGLGTGKRDWGTGFSYTQPLSAHWQLLGDITYRSLGSPKGLDFNNQIRIETGLALVTKRSIYRIRVENRTPVMDEVPVFNGSGAEVGIQDVDDHRLARFEIVRRTRGGGATRISIVKGFNDSSQDLGIVLSISTNGL